MAVSTILNFQNIKFTVIYTSDWFRKDNILFDMCMYVTFIGSLVIFIKKRVSRQITQRIPKSNILPRHTNNQVRPNNEISTGDLFLLHQKYLDGPFFCLQINIFRVLFVICRSSNNLDSKKKQNYRISSYSCCGNYYFLNS